MSDLSVMVERLAELGELDQLRREVEGWEASAMIGRRRHGGCGPGSRIPPVRIRLRIVAVARRAARSPLPPPWWRRPGVVWSLRRYRMGLPT